MTNEFIGLFYSSSAVIINALWAGFVVLPIYLSLCIHLQLISIHFECAKECLVMLFWGRNVSLWGVFSSCLGGDKISPWNATIISP